MKYDIVYNVDHHLQSEKNILSQKLKIYDDTISEWQNMKNNGYDRIWDCGSYKYLWENK